MSLRASLPSIPVMQSSQKHLPGRERSQLSTLRITIRLLIAFALTLPGKGRSQKKGENRTFPPCWHLDRRKARLFRGSFPACPGEPSGKRLLSAIGSVCGLFTICTLQCCGFAGERTAWNCVSSGPERGRREAIAPPRCSSRPIPSPKQRPRDRRWQASALRVREIPLRSLSHHQS
jgi:hypothetical protein